MRLLPYIFTLIAYGLLTQSALAQPDLDLVYHLKASVV